MSYAVMPLSDYKTACDKVREKVDLTTVKFEETDFGFLRSEVFTVPQDSVYIFSYEFSDSSKFPDLYYSSPEWEGETSPGYFEPIDSNSAKTTSELYTGVQYRIFIADSLGLTPKDIFKASLSLDEETVVDFVPPPKIKSGELAEKVDEVYWTAANSFGLKGKGQGELVHFENVHPIEHKVEVGLGSKNLFNEAEANITKTEDYFKSNVGYSTDAFYSLAVEPNETYIATFMIRTEVAHLWGSELGVGIGSLPTYGQGRITLSLIPKESYQNFATQTIRFTVPADVHIVYFQTNTEYKFKNFQIEKSNSATAYAPFVADFSDYKVKVSGNNLFDISKVPNTAVITNNGDGSITISGTYSARTGKKLGELCPSLKVGDVVIFQIVTTGNALIYLAGSGYTWNNGASKTITEADLNSIVTLYGKTDNGTYTISQIWFSYGATPTEYAEYIEPTEYTAAADGTVEGVKSISPTMNLSTDKAGAVIDAECYLDPEAVITDLTNTVITLGGEI